MLIRVTTHVNHPFLINPMPKWARQRCVKARERGIAQAPVSPRRRVELGQRGRGELWEAKDDEAARIQTGRGVSGRASAEL